MFGLFRNSGGPSVLEALKACPGLQCDSSEVLEWSVNRLTLVVRCLRTHFGTQREKVSAVMLKILPTTLQFARVSRSWQFFTRLVRITNRVVFRLTNVVSITQYSMSLSKNNFTEYAVPLSRMRSYVILRIWETVQLNLHKREMMESEINKDSNKTKLYCWAEGGEWLWANRNKRRHTEGFED